MEKRSTDAFPSLGATTDASVPSASTASAASLLGTVTLLVNDTQVDVTRLIYMLYLDIEQQINRADMKAQITLSTSAILIGVMVNLGVGVDFKKTGGLAAGDRIVTAGANLLRAGQAVRVLDAAAPAAPAGGAASGGASAPAAAVASPRIAQRDGSSR
jgi:hypothetical protein